jgi:hypothetical protein
LHISIFEAKKQNIYLLAGHWYEKMIYDCLSLPTTKNNQRQPTTTKNNQKQPTTTNDN